MMIDGEEIEGEENTGTEIPGETGEGASGEKTGGDPTDLERVAADLGWAPEDKWRGDPTKWVDAEAFVRQGPEILKATLRSQDGQLTGMKQTIERMAKVQDTIVSTAYDRAHADIETRKRAAVEDGDTAAYDAATAHEVELDKSRPAADAAPAKPNPDLEPAFIAFQAENPWYGADGDPDKTLEAERAASVIGRKYGGKDMYDRVAAHVAAKFPEGGGGARPRAPGVESPTSRAGGNRGGKKSGPKYGDLPPEAKAACDKAVKEMVKGKPLMTQDAYVAKYFEDEVAA